jgi:ATP/ADP translocase
MKYVLSALWGSIVTSLWWAVVASLLTIAGMIGLATMEFEE